MGIRERLLRRLLGQHTPQPAPFTPQRRGPAPTLGDYTPRHPELLQLQPEHLDPRFAAALADGRPEALRALLDEVHPEVYAFTPVTDAWRQQLVEEILHFETWVLETGCRHDPPNSMNNYGVILDQIGFQPMLSAVMAQCVAPLAAELFAEVGGETLDEHHGFAVEYRPGGDVDLGFHVDASDVTLNLCLGSSFVGGELYFEGRRCELHRQTGCSSADRFVYRHRPGVALLHAGKHRHGALEIRQGERINLIVWCRSTAYARQQAEAAWDACPEWCQRSMLR